MQIVTLQDPQNHSESLEMLFGVRYIDNCIDQYMCQTLAFKAHF